MPVTAADLDAVLALERELQSPAARGDVARLRELLAPDFVEVGASGRRWDLATILGLLADETAGPDADEIVLSGLEARVLTDDVVQVFWDSDQAGRRARRTSLWRRTPDGWQQAYHQGTLTAVTAPSVRERHPGRFVARARARRAHTGQDGRMTPLTDQPLRRAGRTLLVAALLLAVWVGWLGGALVGDAHRWHWVVLDVLEVLGLLVTGVLVLRGRRGRAALAALLTAPLLCYDALQDVLTSHRVAADFALAIAMALCVELPVACLLVWVARRCTRRA